MNPAEAARFRRGAAKLNYMAQDRADLAYASKEVSRHMAKPEKGDTFFFCVSSDIFGNFPGGCVHTLGKNPHVIWLFLQTATGADAHAPAGPRLGVQPCTADMS